MRLLYRLFISLLQTILNHPPYCLFGVIIFFFQGSDVCPIILSNYALLNSLGIKQMYRECYLLPLVHLVNCYCSIQTQLSTDFTVDFIKKLSFIVFHFFTTFPFLSSKVILTQFNMLRKSRSPCACPKKKKTLCSFLPKESRVFVIFLFLGIAVFQVGIWGFWRIIRLLLLGSLAFWNHLSPNFMAFIWEFLWELLRKKQNQQQSLSLRIIPFILPSSSGRHQTAQIADSP